MAILAVISIILVILDYVSVINLTNGIWMWIDDSILLIFAIDYFYRLYRADNRGVSSSIIFSIFYQLFQSMDYSHFSELRVLEELLELQDFLEFCA